MNEFVPDLSPTSFISFYSMTQAAQPLNTLLP
jgi:hypothetical protein